MHGQQCLWYADGRRQCVSNYDCGVEHSRHRGWYADGQPKYDTNYARGVYDGLVRMWNKGGELTEDDWCEGGVRWARAAASCPICVARITSAQVE